MRVPAVNTLSAFAASVAFVAAMTAPVAEAQIDGPRLTLSPYAGSTIWAAQRGVADGFHYGARVGFLPVPWVGVEGTYGRSETESEGDPRFDIEMRHIGADLVLHFVPNRALDPYLTGGWTQLDQDPKQVNPYGPQAEIKKGFELGIGLNARIWQRDGVRFDLRLDARDAVTNLPAVFGYPEDSFHNFLFTAGIQLALGPGGKDSDADGVKDRKDRCPATPVGALVDRLGCPLDEDGDRVPDGLDTCAATPAGATVDDRGCPKDTDGDGILDGIDTCAGTPPGALVDTQGCPRDDDGDGVVNGLDKCPDTPQRAVVDARGCPNDADADGIPDGIDVCPHTPADLEVDERGCPIEITEMETQILDTGMIRTSEINFETGSAELDPSSFRVLDEVGRTLVQWPQLRIEISGHTDAQGTNAFNQKLSEERAQAVLDYLVAQFPAILVGQFTVVGHGEAKPIATNDTAKGRQKNRRVEFTVLDTDVLKREIERRHLKTKE